MNETETFFYSIKPVSGNGFGNIHLPQVQGYEVCFEQPQKIISDGIWANHTIFTPKSMLSMFELQILTIFLITQSFHFILKLLGFSHLVSQVMAGILLGPSIWTGPLEKYKMMLFPFGTPDILNTISSFGYAFFLFLNSVKMDFTLITKTGKKAWVIALLSLFTPVILGIIFLVITHNFWQHLLTKEERAKLPLVLISHSGCSFAVIASLLSDLKILNSELGRLALSTAFLIEIIGGFVLGVGTAYMGTRIVGDHVTKRNLVLYIVYFIGVPLIGRPAMRWMVKNTQEGKPMNKIYLHITVGMFILLGILARILRQSFFAGAVIFGLAVPEGPPLGSELVNQYELFATWFLTPIFVPCCIMKVDIKKCGSYNLVLVICGIVVMAQSDQAIGVMVIILLILGTISKIGVKSLYDPSRKYVGYQKRNIVHLKQNSELRLVVCVHKQSHIAGMTNFLHQCSPTTDNTLVVDVMHLMELVGRTTPIFIDHCLQQKAGSTSTLNYSGELIVTFDLFEREYAGLATANTYTAISPVTFMHEDVCNLALDKNAAIIILPFHIRWTENKSIESEDYNIRSLNSKVLEKAPCSIGILVNRGIASTHLSSGYKAAMVFLGGPDDREALCLAKRFAKNSNNMLFICRLLAFDHDSTGWEQMIDDEELREARGAYVKLENVKYEERTIEDASKTTTFIREIASNKFDFIVVGRRNGVKSPQTLGLENWSEYTELGVIGDLLASPDMETTASILVVQQQLTTSMSS